MFAFVPENNEIVERSEWLSDLRLVALDIRMARRDLLLRVRGAEQYARKCCLKPAVPALFREVRLRSTFE